eukprot:6882_1
MEQLTINPNETETTSAPFSRPVQRNIDNKNSLDFIFRGSGTFARNWKLKYRLDTKEQQLYFFAFMVGVVAVLKYIDIEFANQPVTIPLGMDEDAIHDHGIMDDLINTTDVIKEQHTTAIFEGSVIPSSTVSQAAIDNNALRRPCKTMRLKKFDVDAPWEETNVFMQEAKDYGYIQFNEREANFLRLIECVRKFAMEYDAKDTEYCLWPWYRNSFHSDETACRDTDNYEELLYRHNFLKAWNVKGLVEYVEDPSIANVENHEKPIRFKRKFAAELLLTPHLTERNINLVRNQFTLLIDDILNNAYKTDARSLVDTSILYVANKQEIENRKKIAIDNYVKKHVSNQQYWPQRIAKSNHAFDDKIKSDDTYGLLDEPLENVSVLDIDRLRLPVFEAFMQFFFIQSDWE